MIEMTMPSTIRSPALFHVVDRLVSPTMTMARIVATVPPKRPSTLLFGLIHERNGVLPAALPSTRAPMSLATTPIASRHSVSVPMLWLMMPEATGKPKPFEYRRIDAANEPRNPIHTMPSMVMAMLGMGAASRLLAPMKVIAPAMNATTSSSGNACSPAQYTATGRATQATMPMTVAGR
jgi:hypothetical protein